MGCAQTHGNSTPAAEFQHLRRPRSRRDRLRGRLALTMIGLDLTYQALATPQVTERISALGTPLAAIVTELMRFFASTYKLVFPS